MVIECTGNINCTIVCMYACMYVCLCVFVCVCTGMCVHVYMYGASERGQCYMHMLVVHDFSLSVFLHCCPFTACYRY